MSATVFHESAAGADTRHPGAPAPEVLPTGWPDGRRQVPAPRSPGRWLNAAIAVFRDQPAGTHRAARRWRVAWRAGSHRSD